MSTWSQAPAPAAVGQTDGSDVATLSRNLGLAISTANEMQAKLVQCNRSNEQLIRERSDLRSELKAVKRALARAQNDAQVAIAQAESAAQTQLAEQSRLHLKEMSAALSRSQEELAQQRHTTTQGGAGVAEELQSARARVTELEENERQLREAAAGDGASEAVAELRQRCARAEASTRKVKAASAAAEARAKHEYQALQRQALVIALQFERQCAAMQKLTLQQDELDGAADAARHVRERETLAMQSELDEAVSEHARLHAALQRKEEEHRVEVRCRSAASAELRQLRAELLEHRETVEKHQRTEDQLRMRVEVLTRELETRGRMRDGPPGGGT